MPIPVPKLPKAPEAPLAVALVGAPWNEERKDDAGADWMERNLLGGGRSSLLYYK